MSDKDKRVPGRSQRLTLAKLTPPDWYGWLGVAAMFLLATVRWRLADGVWFFPLLSLGEWLLMPLGVASLSMGFLSLSRIREKTLLPLWISALVPAILWLATVGMVMLKSGIGAGGGDIFLAWAVHLVFPAMAFLPLLTIRIWRNRLMWALTAGLVANVALISIQARSGGVSAPGHGMWALGGSLANQHDYALMIGIALPLIAAWRGGGGGGKHRAFSVLFCTFLLPALAMAACHTVTGMVAAAVGLTVAWAAWRSYAWILGVFLCLLVVGYGAESHSDRDQAQRRLLADSASLGGSCYRKALNTFQVRPFTGSGPEAFLDANGTNGRNGNATVPWYALLLGGTGLAGLGMWLVLLGELAARTMGRFGRRCLWHGGVLGGVAALAAAGAWTDVLPEGAGAMVGLLIALSILEEPDDAIPARRARKRRDGKPEPVPPPPARRGGDTDVIAKPQPRLEGSTT